MAYDFFQLIYALCSGDLRRHDGLHYERLRGALHRGVLVRRGLHDGNAELLHCRKLLPRGGHWTYSLPTRVRAAVAVRAGAWNVM